VLNGTNAPADLVPDASRNTTEYIRGEIFGRMGFNDSEMVALIGER
jgi:catalase (peroxidase I)